MARERDLGEVLADYACGAPDEEPSQAFLDNAGEPDDEGMAMYEESIQLPDCSGCKTNGRQPHICGALTDRSLLESN